MLPLLLAATSLFIPLPLRRSLSAQISQQCGSIARVTNEGLLEGPAYLTHIRKLSSYSTHQLVNVGTRRTDIQMAFVRPTPSHLAEVEVEELRRASRRQYIWSRDLAVVAGRMDLGHRRSLIEMLLEEQEVELTVTAKATGEVRADESVDKVSMEEQDLAQLGSQQRLPPLNIGDRYASFVGGVFDDDEGLPRMSNAQVGSVSIAQ